VLVVDDEPEVRASLSRYLRRLGCTVDEASDGEDALMQVANAVPDVVVTDMTMPRLDGLGLLKALRSKDSDLPVIVLTGHGTLENIIQAMKDGVLLDYLMKPLPDLALLEMAVRRALEIRLLRDRAREASQVIAMRELAVTASDRILNPLNVIALRLATLSRDAITSEARVQAVANIEQAIDTITKVVRQMGAIARYVPGAVTRGLREIDLETATSRLRESSTPSASTTFPSNASSRPPSCRGRQRAAPEQTRDHPAHGVRGLLR
jgi:DNA-binding NtrC family response regulator